MRAAKATPVVVSGMGAVTGFGVGVEALWHGVSNGQVAIAPLRREPLATLGGGAWIGAEAPRERLPQHEYKKLSEQREPAVDYAVLAAEEAIADCGFEASSIHPYRWGVVMGTCNAGLVSAESWYLADVGRSADPGLPWLIPAQSIAEALAGAFGFRGPCLSVNTACAAGTNAIGLAADLVSEGEADAVIAGGTDALATVVFAGFASLEALSPHPAAPYSADRQGLSLGEGSGVLVLMSEAMARRLGARVRVQIAGYGLSADGYHQTAPHPEGEGAARAIRAALAAAGATAADVRYVNGHGTGTPKNDSAETSAIHLAMGAEANHILVSSTKSMIGHLLGAAGAVEAIVTVRAVEEDLVPPTANYTARDPDCDLDYVPNRARAASVDVALSNSFAFGGANACVAIARPGRLQPPPPKTGRTFITGVAVLSPLGDALDAIEAAVAHGSRPAAGADGLRIARTAADPEPYLSPREARRLDRPSIQAVVASLRALDAAGLRITPENRHRVGVFSATGIGPAESLEQFTTLLIAEGPSAANPAVFPNVVYNQAGGQVSIHSGAVGPASTITTGHAAGASALAYARETVARGRADAMICVASDTLADPVILAYRQMGFLRPGGDFALAEGAGALVLESQEYVDGRQARPLAELMASATACDGLGTGTFDPDGAGLERAMQLALDRAGVSPSGLRRVWTGLTGHPPSDAAELAAIRRILGAGIELVSPRLVLGEPMGVGGAWSAALAAIWLGRQPAGAVALVNSSSMGGTYVSLVLRSAEETAA